MAVIDIKYESYVKRRNEGLDIDSDESMECDIPSDNKLEALSEVVNMKQGDDELLHTNSAGP